MGLVEIKRVRFRGYQSVCHHGVALLVLQGAGGQQVKHVVGSSLFGSPGGHGGRELSSVVRFYPDMKVIATWHSKTASTRIC